MQSESRCDRPQTVQEINMRRRFIAGPAVAVVAWPCAVQAQQSAIPLFQALPLSAQFALLIGPAASAVFAATGLLLAFYQSRRADAQARAALVAEYLRSFTEDEDIQRAYYAVAYSRFLYADDFHGSESERDIDKLLRHFSNIALAWQAGLLSTHDVRPIQYYVLRVTRNDEVRRYLSFMADWSKQQHLGEHPYVVLAQLSEQLSSRSR
jgi:hypothetical protein